MRVDIDTQTLPTHCTSCMEWNSRPTSEKFDARRVAERTRSRSRRNAETPEQAAARRAADRSRSQRRRSESAEHADAQRAAERTWSRRRRSAETSAQTNAPQTAARQTAAELGRSQRRRQVLKSFEEALIDTDSPTDVARLCETFTLHSCGTITEKCQRCQAVFFSSERLSNSSCSSPKFSLCCGDGKVALWSVPQPPKPLANLLTGNATHCRQFRRDIRKYNCAPITLIILFFFSFTF